jgi:RES domain-containing protein
MLKAHPFVLIPSVVSVHSLNVIFDPATAKGFHHSVVQEPIALDPHLHMPTGAVGH